MYQEIQETIKSAVINYEANTQSYNLWKEPIIKIISANNENLKELKKTVSDEHFLPHDILSGAKSIISFFVPFHEDIVESNLTGTLSSEKWATAYIKTNLLIKVINDEIEILMNKNGYETGKIPATHNYDEVKLMSNWSHRHVAYIAGIGTFGINNMLITKNGCCGRLGSIIINYEFNNYDEVKSFENKEKCLYKRNGKCGICRKKCMAGAFSETGFDRHKCNKQLLKNAEQHKAIGYADVCGKCMVGLPCSIRDPTALP